MTVAACTAPPTPSQPPSSDAIAALAARTHVIGSVVRTVAACGWRMESGAQDRAARLETAVIALHEATGGAANRDAFLGTMRPANASTARARDAWCNRQRADIAGIERFLGGPDGLALIAEAETLLASVRP